jgi:hypothetical protein
MSSSTERHLVRCIVQGLLFCFSLSAASAGFVMPPYLQGVTSGSVYVMVECTTRDSVTIQYGPEVKYGQSAGAGSIMQTSGGTFVHGIPIQGLTPGTTYHYRARQSGVSSPDSHFTTGVLPGTPFRFVWMADCRTGSVIFDSVMTRMSARGPLLGLFGGDLNQSGSYASWKTQFFRPPLISFGAVVPWVNAPGNHEGWEANTQAFTHAPAGSAEQDYFSFDCGDLHVLVLDSESPMTSGSEQYEFADRDLGASTRIWKIVMLHKPAYCSGGHGENEGVIAFTSAVLEKRGVDMVLAGHSHFYQHNFVKGIHHMVIGSAGAPLYDPTNDVYTLKSVKQYNWATCDVSPASISLFVFNEKGVPLDTLILTKPKVKGLLK